MIHTDETGAARRPRRRRRPDCARCATDRHLALEPQNAFACEEHIGARRPRCWRSRTSTATSRPSTSRSPDFRGHGLVPLQATQRRAIARCVAVSSRCGCAAWPSRSACRMASGRGTRTGFVFDLEREALRLADILLTPGGDVPALYERHLGSPLPRPARRLRLPLEQPPEPPRAQPRDPGTPLAILYVGRLQRVKGALALVEACMRLEADLRLTMVGADTETAPLGQSDARDDRGALRRRRSGCRVLDPLCARRSSKRRLRAARPARRPLAASTSGRTSPWRQCAPACRSWPAQSAA